jgi:hypothetical protein
MIGQIADLDRLFLREGRCRHEGRGQRRESESLLLDCLPSKR